VAHGSSESQRTAVCYCDFRAEARTDAVVGTSGRVLNELSIKGLNDTTAGELDSQIRKNLDRMVDNDPTLKQRDINFEVVKDVANGLQIEP